MLRLDETRASVTKYAFFLIKMSERPAIDVHGYLISSARTPSVQALFGEKSMTPTLFDDTTICNEFCAKLQIKIKNLLYGYWQEGARGGKN